MDQSWRMRMGMPSTVTAQQLNHPRRRSTEDISHRRRTISGQPENILLDPEDFNDVFGGPPRIIMARQFSGCNSFSRSSLYEEIFVQPENVGPAGKVACNGRSLPEFKIPAGKGGRRCDQGFYSDIFGWDEEEVGRSRTRSGSKSKASSSSALSSEELSPLQVAVSGGGGRDDDVSLFASRLRPINIPSRWGSTRVLQEQQQRQQGPFLWNNPAYQAGNDYNEDFRSFHLGICPGNSSPESIISLEPNSCGIAKASADEFVPNSPSSAVSSVCQDPEVVAGKAQDEMMQDQSMEQEEEEDEVMDSYVIEISSDNREGTDDAIGVDEAIAWAKEKFQEHRSEDTCSANHNGKAQEQFAEAGETVRREQQIPERQKIDGHLKTEASEMEMELLDENVRLWSTGKEADIRLLLSTLHHILWPNSGWLPVPLASLIESSHVKKAYQKARLCLHPDKLQQRGATLPQKHVAEKAFSILQEAWAAFINQDVF